jgi:hypothetical protein
VSNGFAARSAIEGEELPEGKPKENQPHFCEKGNKQGIRRGRENGAKISCVNNLGSFINGRGIPAFGKYRVRKRVADTQRKADGCGDNIIISPSVIFQIAGRFFFKQSGWGVSPTAHIGKGMSLWPVWNIFVSSYAATAS